MNPFLDALINSYTYECEEQTIKLTNEKTYHEHGRYFVVECEKCCNIPVYHLLTRK